MSLRQNIRNSTKAIVAQQMIHLTYKIFKKDIQEKKDKRNPEEHRFGEYKQLSIRMVALKKHNI